MNRILFHMMEREVEADKTSGENIARTFSHLDKVSAFNICSALSSIEGASFGEEIPESLSSYIMFTMNEYRKSIRTTPLDLSSFSDSTKRMYANFRLAQTWKDVKKAFESVKLGTEEDMVRDLRRISFHRNTGEPISRTDSPLVDPEDLINIQEHFEGIILKIVEDLNDVENLKKSASSLSDSLVRNAYFDFIIEVVKLARRGISFDNASETLKHIFSSGGLC